VLLLSPNSLRTTALRGVMSFDEDGSGTFRSDELQLNASITNTGQQQVGGATNICELAYTVDADGHVSIVLTGCAATGVSGLIKGQHFAASPVATDGHLSADGKTLLLSDVDAPVSTGTAVETGLTSVRVCSRTGTAVRIR
jgi:hypothetical protein